jgi:hypothetical protein
MGTPNGPMTTGGAQRPTSYSPPAGTASGIPGAAYPVLGSSPVTNMQPRYAQPGMAQMRPGMPQGAPQGMPQGAQANPQMGASPEALATILGHLGGSPR